MTVSSRPSIACVSHPVAVSWPRCAQFARWCVIAGILAATIGATSEAMGGCGDYLVFRSPVGFPVAVGRDVPASHGSFASATRSRSRWQLGWMQLGWMQADRFVAARTFTAVDSGDRSLHPTGGLPCEGPRCSEPKRTAFPIPFVPVPVSSLESRAGELQGDGRWSTVSLELTQALIRYAAGSPHAPKERHLAFPPFRPPRPTC
ncbi:MAG: hypothetical protein RLY70_4220 [Planctomycetota bacterium]